MNSVLIALIAQVVGFENGVGLLNDRGKMIGWIDIPAQDPELRQNQFERVLGEFNAILNDPRHAQQPDYAHLNEEGAA
ncbi:hypothetical protein CKO27_16245 [Thiocystis violacea]|nr:hypothetical protein [Thiocystis violacea]